jgi:hypothetical protein
VACWRHVRVLRSTSNVPSLQRATSHLTSRHNSEHRRFPQHCIHTYLLISEHAHLHCNLLRSSSSSKRTLKPSPAAAISNQLTGMSTDPWSQLTGGTSSDQLGAPHLLQNQLLANTTTPASKTASPSNPRKRRLSGQPVASTAAAAAPSSSYAADTGIVPSALTDPDATAAPPPVKKGRTNTPWTPQEEQRLKQMRDAGKSWSEIAKVTTTTF